MKINTKANQIRNLNLSEDRKSNFEIKKEFLEILKNKTWYKKDMKISESRRKRRENIRELAGNDVSKIKELKNILYTQEEKDEEMIMRCPFPKHKWYFAVWKNLKEEEQNTMKENIRITNDGKIEIIKMKKKFFLMNLETLWINNEQDIKNGRIDKINWTYKDREWNTWVKGITYFNGKWAEQEAKKYNKKLLLSEDDEKQFIESLPWEYMWQKIENLFKLFELDGVGFFFNGERSFHEKRVWYSLFWRADNKAHNVSKWMEFAYKNWSWSDAYREHCYPFIFYEDC